MHPAATDPEQLLRDCDVRRHRTRGPGGQHRNKTDSAVELLHRPSGTAGHASERRSQHENLRVATFRLRVNLALAVRGHFDPLDGGSELWRSRVGRDGRIALNPEHHDFPAMLAEALDAVHAVKFDLPKAARLLGCTASQLVKLIKHEPRALASLNEQLKSRGKHGLA